MAPFKIKENKSVYIIQDTSFRPISSHARLMFEISSGWRLERDITTLVLPLKER